MKVKDHVIYVDEHYVEHDALLTNVFDNGDEEKFPNPAVNLIFVSGDEDRKDGFGRQLERRSSCAHLSFNSARANGWKRPGETF